MAGEGSATWWGPSTTVADDELVVALVAKATGTAPELAAEQLKASRRQYLIIECLGRSTFAEVWLAVDRVLGRRVVVKLLNQGGITEARAVTMARHPNVIEIHHFGVCEDREYAVFEYCEGTTLASWCAGRSWSEIIDRIIEAGRGLQHCHDHDLVHGDVKPENILITQGRAVVADFGLAGDPGAPVERGGTPGYIAPELAAGVRGPKADVYALAVTAWRCLFGAPPYPGSSAAALLVAALEDRPKQPERVPEGLPSELGEVIVLGMHPNPGRRPSMEKWLRDLSDAAALPSRMAARLRVARTVVVTVLVTVLVSFSGHAMQGACAADTKQVAVEVEPSIERAMALAQGGDPFGAYAQWWQLTEGQLDESEPSSAPAPLEAVALAEVMLEATLALPEGDRGMAAEMTDRVAATAGLLARGDSELESRANAVRRRVEGLSRGNRRSRPR